ncbi:MAG TPA: kinase [Bacteroidetes bacterium]|nr:kinase [Bacteroidota bacterium]
MKNSKKENSYICVIGAANIDIVGFPEHPLKYRDANIGNLKISLGGVGRNIAENLSRLGLSVKLITALGGDIYGKKIIGHCRESGLDISDSLILKNRNSSVHLAIMDRQNDLALGLSAMDICDEINVGFIKNKKKQIKDAQLVVLDTNVPEETLAEIIKNNAAQKYFLDTVSAAKALRAKNILPKLFILKCNQIESEVLTGIKITDKASLKKSAAILHKKGAINIFITMGNKGAFYSNGDRSDIVVPKKINAVNTNGAGDAFSAGLIYGSCKGWEIGDWTKAGMACAEAAISSKNTVNPALNKVLLTEILSGHRATF